MVWYVSWCETYFVIRFIYLQLLRMFINIFHTSILWYPMCIFKIPINSFRFSRFHLILWLSNKRRLNLFTLNFHMVINLLPSRSCLSYLFFHKKITYGRLTIANYVTCRDGSNLPNPKKCNCVLCTSPFTTFYINPGRAASNVTHSLFVSQRACFLTAA